MWVPGWHGKLEVWPYISRIQLLPRPQFSRFERLFEHRCHPTSLTSRVRHLIVPLHIRREDNAEVTLSCSDLERKAFTTLRIGEVVDNRSIMAPALSI